MIMTPTNWDNHFATLRRRSLIERVRIHSVWSGYRRLLAGRELLTTPRILELGAGSGHVSLKLVQRFAGRATLVDKNDRAIAFSKMLWGRAGLLDQVEHVRGNLLEFSDKDGFDLVHSGGVIEHFHGTDRDRIVAAHARHVRPSGQLIIVVPIDSWRYRAFKRLLESLGKWIYTDEIPWKDGDVAQAFRPYGLELQAATVIGHEIGYLLEHPR